MKLTKLKKAEEKVEGAIRKTKQAVEPLESIELVQKLIPSY